MNNIWYRLILIALLLMFVLAPFAGFAPLLLIIVIAGIAWAVATIVRILIYGKQPDEERG